MKHTKHDLLSFSFAMDDMDEIFLRVLDSTWYFCFGITSTLASSRTKLLFSDRVMKVIRETL